MSRESELRGLEIKGAGYTPARRAKVVPGGTVSNATGTQQSTGDRARAGLLTCLALLSGSCGLAYEVLYVRALTSVLGDMFYVHAALLSTFLIGVGLGAKAASRCRRWLWAFEILTGLYALVLPFSARWFSHQTLIGAVTSSPALTILMTIGFVAIPSVLIGFSIPLFSAYIKASLRGRPAFQGIYKAYNLGALLSVLGVELLLVRAVGVRTSLAAVGVVNLVNGVVLLLMKAAPAAPPPNRPRRFPRRAMVALALASFCSAAFQMFFLKLCYLVFEPHRENFAVGLAVAMLGIFLGAWLGSRVRIRFETLLLLIAAVLGLNYLAYLPILELWEATSSWSRGSELLFLAHKLGFGCLFALGPMTLFGATIPVLMRAEGEVAAESGHLLWVSSLAMASGYLAYVLLGHPLVATDVLLAMVGGISIAGAAVATGSRWSKAQTGLAVTAVALFALLLTSEHSRSGRRSHQHRGADQRRHPSAGCAPPRPGAGPGAGRRHHRRRSFSSLHGDRCGGDQRRLPRDDAGAAPRQPGDRGKPERQLVPLRWARVLDRQAGSLRRDSQLDPRTDLLLGVEDLHPRVLPTSGSGTQAGRRLQHLAGSPRDVGGGGRDRAFRIAAQLPLLRSATDARELLYGHLLQSAGSGPALRRAAGTAEPAQRASAGNALDRYRRVLRGHQGEREPVRASHSGGGEGEHG